MTVLSIIVVSFNTREYLERCLRSIYDHSPPVSFEIYVVDNDSSDGSAEMVRQKFPRVRLMRNSENVGFARANNQALRICSGEYALLLNSDTEIIGTALDDLVAFMDAHKDAGIVGAQLVHSDGTLQPSGGRILSWMEELWWAFPFYRLAGKRVSDKFRDPARDYSLTAEVEEVSGACMMVRRLMWEQVGQLDERYFFCFEDVEYCARASKKGWKVYYFPGAKIIHHWGRSAEKGDELLPVRYMQGYYRYLLQMHGLGFQIFMRGIMILKSLMKIPYLFFWDRRKMRVSMAIVRVSLFTARTTG